MTDMYTGLNVQVERVVSDSFPEVFVDLTVRDRWGNPLVGLTRDNFRLTERYAEVNEPDLVRRPGSPGPGARGGKIPGHEGIRRATWAKRSSACSRWCPDRESARWPWWAPGSGPPWRGPSAARG